MTRFSCLHCHELLSAEEEKEGLHFECSFAAAIGGPAHVAEICRCYGGSAPENLPHWTRRENARAALLAWRLKSFDGDDPFTWGAAGWARQ